MYAQANVQILARANMQIYARTSDAMINKTNLRGRFLLLLLLPCTSLYGLDGDASASKQAYAIVFNDVEDDESSLSEGKRNDESKLRGEKRTESGEGGGGSGGGGGRGEDQEKC